MDRTHNFNTCCGKKKGMNLMRTNAKFHGYAEHESSSYFSNKGAQKGQNCKTKNTSDFYLSEHCIQFQALKFK